MSNIKEITSIDSKFDTLKNFYKEFKKLEGVKNETKETKQKKITVLKNASLLYDELVRDYKKEYIQIFKSKDKEWRLKHDYKNLKDLDYQPDKLQPGQSISATKMGKSDRNRFDEIQSIVIEAKRNKLKTSADGKEFKLNNAESLLKDISSAKIDGSEFKKRYSNVIDDVETILKLNVTRNQNKKTNK